MTLTVSGGPQLMARLHAIGKSTEEIVREVGLGTVREAKLVVPRRTGNLGRTIRLGAVSSTSVEVRAGGQNNVGYAAAVEFGTKPHDIVPRRAKALAWGGARTLGGRVKAGSAPTHFAKRVHHPGTKAEPYLFPSFRKVLSAIGLDKMIERWNEAA